MAEIHKTSKNPTDTSVSPPAVCGQSENSLDDIVLPQALVDERPDLFTDPQIKWMLKTRHRNGLEKAGAVLKVSKKLYLRKSKFISWFLTQKAA